MKSLFEIIFSQDKVDLELALSEKRRLQKELEKAGENQREKNRYVFLVSSKIKLKTRWRIKCFDFFFRILDRHIKGRRETESEESKVEKYFDSDVN